MKRAHWDRLERDARRVVEAALRELPRELQAPARAVPCLFQEWNEEDPDLLGLYADFSPGEMSDGQRPDHPLPRRHRGLLPRRKAADFEDEVRLTFLHELGHHFGWDEGDLEERGLGVG